MTTAKLHWNRVLSTPDGKYLIVDVKNFYLNNPINKSEYIKIALKIPPPKRSSTHMTYSESNVTDTSML